MSEKKDDLYIEYLGYNRIKLDESIYQWDGKIYRYIEEDTVKK